MKRELWAGVTITDDEGEMLYKAGRSDAYQPRADQLDLANSLIEKGWLEKDEAFPAVLVPTQAGTRIAYTWADVVAEARERQREGYRQAKRHA